MAIKIEKSMFRHGECWVRADFHLHTKADDEFVYKGTEEEFVPQFVERLLQEDVRVGVIKAYSQIDFIDDREGRRFLATIRY